MSTHTTYAVTTTYTVKAVALRRAYAILKAANPYRESHIATVRLMWTGDDFAIALPPTADINRRVISLSGDIVDYDNLGIVRHVHVDVWERVTRGITGSVNVTAHADGTVSVGAATVPSVESGPEWKAPMAVNGDFVSPASCTVTADDLRFVGSAASVSDTMPLFTGIYFDSWDIAATDRYRLHVAPVTPDHPNGDVQINVIVPNRTVKAVLRGKPEIVHVSHHDYPYAGSAGAVTLIAHGTYGERIDITVRPLVGNFPKWRDLMPEINDSTLIGICDRAEFKRVLVVSSVAERNMPVRFTLGSRMQSVGTVLAECGNVDNGYAFAEMSYRPNVTNELTNDRTLAFNPSFLSDILSTLPADDYVRWFQTDPKKPAVFRGLTDDYRTALLMPVKL